MNSQIGFQAETISTFNQLGKHLETIQYKLDLIMCRILIVVTIVVHIWAGKYSRCVVHCHEAISILYLTISDFPSVQFLREQLKIQGSHTF